MAVRTPIFDLLRPYLKGGWNEPGLIDRFSAELDRLGAASDPVQVEARPADTAITFAQRQIDIDLLIIAFPQTSGAVLAGWVEPTRQACVRFGVDTFREIASFLANIGVESAGLTRLSENLNYSTEALITKFGRHRISVADAERFGRNASHPADQVALANILYGGEFGRRNLGNTEPGDGWKFRGYGPKQITGRANFAAFAAAMGISIDSVADYVRTPEGGMASAGWFWKSHGLDAKAATPGVADDRKAINGGTFGLAEVERIFDRIIAELLRREARNG